MVNYTDPKATEQRDAAIAQATDLSNLNAQREGMLKLTKIVREYTTEFPFSRKDDPCFKEAAENLPAWLQPVYDAVAGLLQSDDSRVVNNTLSGLFNLVHNPAIYTMPEADKMPYLESYRDAIIGTVLNRDNDGAYFEATKNLHELVLNASILRRLPEEKQLPYIAPAIKAYARAVGYAMEDNIPSLKFLPLEIASNMITSFGVHHELSDEKITTYVDTGMKAFLDERDAAPADSDTKILWGIVIHSLLGNKAVTPRLSEEVMKRTGQLDSLDDSGEVLHKKLDIWTMFLSTKDDQTAAPYRAMVDSRTATVMDQFNQEKATLQIGDKFDATKLESLSQDYNYLQETRFKLRPYSVE